MNEYQKWQKDLGKTVTEYKIKYFEGPETIKSDEERAAYLDQHVKDFVWIDDLDGRAIESAFTKEFEDRQYWLENQMETDTYLDSNNKEIRYLDFINVDFKRYVEADLQRSIPSMIDGLKPCQRKILFYALKKPIIQEIEVDEFCAYMFEHSPYHHGEESLVGTIIGMAQNYVGSNNINLLRPNGHFGTRLMGGKDHDASGRCLSTQLSPITRYLFPKDDDGLILVCLNDEVPAWFYPIIPMVLVNGSEGRGIVCSSFIPNYHPRDIISNIKRLLNVEKMEPMLPWYNGFKGEIEERETPNDTLYTTKGKIEDVKNDSITITELPVGKWTFDYEQSLVEASLDEKDIKDYTARHGDTNNVRFEITMTKDQMIKSIEEGLNKFKLTTTLSTANMHLMLFKENQLVKYNTPEQILQDFFRVRLKLYGQRRIFRIRELERALKILENKVNFILQVCTGKILMFPLKRHFERCDELKKKGFQSLQSIEGREVTKEEELRIGYNYLLSIPVESYSDEKMEELNKEVDEKNFELSELETSSPKDLWLKDLDHLIRKLDATTSMPLVSDQPNANTNNLFANTQSPLSNCHAVMLDFSRQAVLPVGGGQPIVSESPSIQQSTLPGENTKKRKGKEIHGTEGMYNFVQQPQLFPAEGPSTQLHKQGNLKNQSTRNRISYRRRTNSHDIRRGASSSNGGTSNEGPYPLYEDLGDCTYRCRYCGAAFWYGERVKRASTATRTEYHLCCGDGKIIMQQQPDPPQYFQDLLSNRGFMENIRAYNQMFAMTSFGANIDKSINDGRGPYVFKVSGQIYHRIGALCKGEWRKRKKKSSSSKVAHTQLNVEDAVQSIDHHRSQMSANVTQQPVLQSGGNVSQENQRSFLQSRIKLQGNDTAEKKRKKSSLNEGSSATLQQQKRKRDVGVSHYTSCNVSSENIQLPPIENNGEGSSTRLHSRTVGNDMCIDGEASSATNLRTQNEGPSTQLHKQGNLKNQSTRNRISYRRRTNSHDIRRGASSSNGGTSNEGPYPLYEDLGDCTYRCRYCGAAFWYGERVKRASTATRTEYHLCCGDGKIIMQQQPDPPQYFQDLLSNQGLIHFLDTHNELVQTLRTARDLCNQDEIPDFKLRLYNAGGARGYELPTSNNVAAIVFGSGPITESDYDVIIQYKNSPAQRINKLHQSYMSLQFPLIFIYGQPGFHTKLRLRSANPTDKPKRPPLLSIMSAHHAQETAKEPKQPQADEPANKGTPPPALEIQAEESLQQKASPHGTRKTAKRQLFQQTSSASKKQKGPAKPTSADEETTNQDEGNMED
ncbi:DNA topoisomerase 2 [Artemisia annua]|nr:DNA topoisomerase 2 [Artemisia annua]